MRTQLDLWLWSVRLLEILKLVFGKWHTYSLLAYGTTLNI
jgi:hypothetical protein